jgi:Family of unknown function (DUF6496)
MKEKKTSTSQKTVSKVMHEFKEGELHIGNSDTIVTSRKQAIAIALSEVENLKKIKNK